MYALRLVTPPSQEPVTVEEVKAYLDVTREDRDRVLELLAKAARRRVEDESGRQLMAATYQLILDRFPCGNAPIRLPKPPLASVTSITYTDAAGDSQTMDAADYQASLYDEPARITPAYGQSWPTTRDKPGAVVVQYVAGMTSRTLVDERAKQAIFLIVGAADLNREEVVTGTIATALPLSASYLIEQLRVGEEFTEYAA